MICISILNLSAIVYFPLVFKMEEKSSIQRERFLFFVHFHLLIEDVRLVQMSQLAKWRFWIWEFFTITLLQICRGMRLEK